MGTIGNIHGIEPCFVGHCIVTIHNLTEFKTSTAIIFIGVGGKAILSTVVGGKAIISTAVWQKAHLAGGGTRPRWRESRHICRRQGRRALAAMNRRCWTQGKRVGRRRSPGCWRRRGGCQVTIDRTGGWKGHG